MRLLDLFCGRFGWSRAFAARGWECWGIDLTVPPEIPEGCNFLKLDVLGITSEWIAEHHFDFICASSPCEPFSVHGMKHFHPNPPYPELGLKLFNHARELCEASGVPYVMENVRAAQKFVGKASAHAGPFYLWWNISPIFGRKLPEGINKGINHDRGSAWCAVSSHSKERQAMTAAAATIPPELSNCIADYAENILVRNCK
jgi:hypothetical protein